MVKPTTDSAGRASKLGPRPRATSRHITDATTTLQKLSTCSVWYGSLGLLYRKGQLIAFYDEEENKIHHDSSAPLAALRAVYMWARDMHVQTTHIDNREAFILSALTKLKDQVHFLVYTHTPR